MYFRISRASRRGMRDAWITLINNQSIYCSASLIQLRRLVHAYSEVASRKE